VLTGAARSSYATPSERRDESLRPGEAPKWDDEPLTAEDTDASDLSSAVENNRDIEMSSDEEQYDEETGLTASQKRQRRRRRRQRRKLDARIADVKSTRSIFNLGMADRNVVKRLSVNGGLILMWYFFSLSISIVSDLSPLLL
jgi:solute carrier family 35 protein C2